MAVFSTVMAVIALLAAVAAIYIAISTRKLLTTKKVEADPTVIPSMYPKPPKE